MRRLFCSFALLLCLTVAGGGVAASAGEATASAIDAARARVAAGDTVGAIEGLEPYVRAHPADVAAGRLLGDLYFRVPDYRSAERTWKTLIVRDPRDRETHNRLGGLYAVQDRINEAIAEFDKSLPLRDSFGQLVELHRRAGDLGSFLSGLQTEAQAAPNDLGVLVRYGNVLRSMHRYAEALPVFRKIVAMKPDDCNGLVDIAYDLVDLNRVDEAMPPLRTCLKGDPHNYPALVNLGEAFLEKNDIGKAKSLIEAALVERPYGAAALVDRGYIADVQGRAPEAIRSYQLAIASEPLEIEAYIDLGYDYSDMKLYPLAEATFLKGLSVAPSDGRLHFLLAMTYNVQGKIALARSQFNIALQSDQELVVRAARDELAMLPKEPAR